MACSQNHETLCLYYLVKRLWFTKISLKRSSLRLFQSFTLQLTVGQCQIRQLIRRWLFTLLMRLDNSQRQYLLYKSTKKAIVVSNRQRYLLRCLRSTRLRQSKLAISLVDFHPLPLLPLSFLLITPNLGDNHSSNDKLCQLLQKCFPT